MTKEQAKYMELVRRFPLRPIRSEKELGRASKIVNTLIDRPALGAGERDYLDVLGDLIEAYEEEHHPMPKVSDARLLQHLIEAKGVTQTEVAQATGIANSTISAVLKGTRQLTREHIGQLAVYFHVEPGAFAFGVEEKPQRARAARASGSKTKSSELVDA